MEYESILAVVFVSIVLVFSLDFYKQYTSTFHVAARHPFLRFLAGLVVVVLADMNPSLAALALIVVFFWVADVHLLSSFPL